MANVLTPIIPTLYSALQVVSRELTGMIPAVTINADDTQRAAKGQTITVPYVPAATASDITPGVTPPDDGDVTVESLDLTISKSRRVPVRWSGEDEKTLSTGDKPQHNSVLQSRIAQAIRTLTNEMEADLASLYTEFSRAYGTAGTTPFGSSLADAAQAKKILDDNGAPGDRSLVLGTAGGVNLRTLTQLTNVNQAGTAGTLRQGELLDLFGMSIKESAQIKTHTKGTGTSYQTAETGEVGELIITVDTGSGTINAGDIITFAADTVNKYVALDGTAGDITLGRPGLLTAIADNNAVTIGDNYTANMAFARSAVLLVTRPPAIPTMNGQARDSAIDRFMLTDPVTGMSFEVSVYEQYKQIQLEVAAAWGFKVVNPEHTAIVLG